MTGRYRRPSTANRHKAAATEPEQTHGKPPDWNCSGCNTPDGGCPREIDIEPYCCGTCRATAGRSHGR